MAAQLGRAERLSAQPCGRAVERGHVQTLEHRLLVAEEVQQEQEDIEDVEEDTGGDRHRALGAGPAPCQHWRAPWRDACVTARGCTDAL